jgi:hypothetical protein
MYQGNFKSSSAPAQVRGRAYAEAVDAEAVAAARGGDAHGVEQLGNPHLRWQLPRPMTMRNPSPSTGRRCLGQVWLPAASGGWHHDLDVGGLAKGVSRGVKCKMF